MKNLNYNVNTKELIGYALSFAGFVLPKIEVDEIILFGSAARGEAEKESDIDLFFNVKKNEEILKKELKKELERFYKTKIFEIWSLKGIKNQIKIEVGNLDEWKLKRSIISDGIILYGKYKSMPEKTKGFVQFNLKPIKNIAKRNNILRKIFGRKEKDYSTKGQVEEANGKKLSALSFIVPLEKTEEVFKLFNSEKIDYTFFEFWSDAF
jgi:predicted nucleotidyltransferase